MRPGLIVRGECWIAPSRLNVSRHADAVFAQMAGNGVLVLFNGQRPPGPVMAYDEQKGTLTTTLGEARGDGEWATATAHGRVKALPGNS